WAMKRDLTLAWRHPGETVLVVAFFVLVASLFPLGIGAEPQLLARIGPGVIWVCALLAAFLSLPSLLAGDYADGSLEQMTLAPLIGLQYGLSPDTLLALCAALAIGTPVLSLLGAACTALTLGARGGGM